MYKTKVRKIGKSKGIILPKELLDRMGVSEGDVLTVRETPTGYALLPSDQEFEEEMQILDKVISKYRHTLKKLAE